MKKSLVSLLVGLSVVSSFNLSATEEDKRWFEVEVIIFERNVNATKVKEHWDEALYPTFSNNNLDPMVLFLEKANLVDRVKTTEIALLDGESLALSTDGPQAGFIDDISEFPDLGIQEKTVPMPLLDKPAVKTLGVVKSTTVTIDGASLKGDVQYPEFKIVPASELQLTAQFSALDKHANYNVLLHSAWRMPPKTRKGALPIRLFAGKNFQQEYNMDGSAKKRPAKTNLDDDDAVKMQPINDGTFIELDNVEFVDEALQAQNQNQSKLPTPVQAKTVMPKQATAPVWQLDGELTIYLEHYLYAKTDLFIRKEGVKVIRSTPPTPPSRVSDELIMSKENDVDLLALSGIHLKGEPASEQLPETVNFLNKPSVTENKDATNTELGTPDQVDDAQIQERRVPFLNSYPMQQLRVIRSGEIHYLDHPMFGMIIQIRKYELPDVAPESEVSAIEIMQ
jgi:hypothetical protein